MDIQQMMERLSAGQEQMKADRKSDKDEMRTNQANMLDIMEVKREERRVGQENCERK
jgi:hypothetical protein